MKKKNFKQKMEEKAAKAKPVDVDDVMDFLVNANEVFCGTVVGLAGLYIVYWILSSIIPAIHYSNF
jgi:hypothetical protein